jgi:glycylpeptide N-tetradecanoyltransferase
MKMRGFFDHADKLVEMAPLFDPHDFWNHQPVPKMNEKNDPTLWDKSIEVKTLEQVSKEPYNLPSGYSWDDLDLADDVQAKELYDLLT